MHHLSHARFALFTAVIAISLTAPVFAAVPAQLRYLNAPNDINQKYYTDGKSVYYKMGEGKDGPEFVKLRGSDKATFRILTAKGDLGVYQKDKRSAYYHYVKISAANVPSFEPIGDGYAWDRSSVFYIGRRLKASRKSFRLLGDSFAMDGKKVFFQGEELKGADAVTFRVTQNRCGEDKKNTFCDGKPSRRADPESFTSFDIGITKDAKHVWCAGETFTIFDAPSFEPIGPMYAKDKNHVYLMNLTVSTCKFHVIPEGDPSTLQPLKIDGMSYANYALDSKHVFFNGEVLRGADPKTFDPRGK